MNSKYRDCPINAEGMGLCRVSVEQSSLLSVPLYSHDSVCCWIHDDVAGVWLGLEQVSSLCSQQRVGSLVRACPWSKLMSPSQRLSGQDAHIVARRGNLKG